MKNIRPHALAMSVVALALFGGNQAMAQQPGYVSEEFVFDELPHPSCHASTIAFNRDGELVCAWFGGSYEKHPDVGIWVSTKKEIGWTKPTEVANGVQYTTVDGKVHRHPCWNPVLFQPPQGHLVLFYKVGPSPSEWWGMTSLSEKGEIWTDGQRLPEGIAGPIKNKALLLEDGTLLCPTSTEDDGWRVHMELYTDQGWQRTEALNDGEKIGAIQPAILQLEDGTLRALGRTQQGKIFSISSSDQGRHWGEMTLTNLPNPNSGIDAVTLTDGQHVLVYNHTRKGRSPLNVAVSKDGDQWQSVYTLESTPGEYSYPAVIEGPDGLVHITYTFHRERIKHVVLDPKTWKTSPLGE